ncbi:HLH DNA-binding domain superfamily protein [Dorcoceras hygrometricum]|uniref:HLH DNA-binding domain superfamily protein n=1 Tax=Dorcoceras hygrometricum TaxID=472368 RepID=A0A2Z7D7E7_9LAMI|nr:HLH DNA-binding domain superfamily protein [Dorcoceras hygrometricum]
MMTSAVTSQSAESYSATSSWYLKLAIAKRCRLDKWIRQHFAFALKIQQMLFAMVIISSHKMMYQSRATVDPVAGYSAIAYQSTWNPDARKAEVAKNCNQAQSIQSSKNPVAATTKRPAKERIQRTISVGALQNTFEREEFVSNGFNLNRGFIYEGNAVEEDDDCSAVAVDVGCTVHQQRENEPEAKLSTIILEKA